jgi:hypothetical protein
MVQKRKLDSRLIAKHHQDAELKRKEREFAVAADTAEMNEAEEQRRKGFARAGEEEVDEEQDSFMQEAEAGSGEVEQEVEQEAVHGTKRRMTAAERKRAKKARKNGKAEARGGGGGGEGGEGEGGGEGGGSASGGGSGSMDSLEDSMGGLSKKERKAAKEADRKKHYIAHGISEHDSYVEGKYQAGENEKTADGSMAQLASLDSNVLDLMSDDAKKMQDNKRIMHWDKRKNKYVQRTVGELARGNVKHRNEAGQVVSQTKRKQAEEQGKYYAKWVKKNNRTIGENEYDASTMDGEEGEQTEGGPAVLNVAADYRGGRLAKRTSGFGMGEVNYKIGGVVANAEVEEELKDEDVMRKEAEEEQNKSDRNKGKKFMTRKGKDGKDGKKSHKFRNAAFNSKSKMIVRTKGGRGGGGQGRHKGRRK